MKTQEEINEWLENLPQSEKAKMQIQKEVLQREYKRELSIEIKLIQINSFTVRSLKDYI